MHKLLPAFLWVLWSTGCVDRGILKTPECPSERSGVRAFEERTGFDVADQIAALGVNHLDLELMEGIVPTTPVPGLLVLDPYATTRVRSFDGREIRGQVCYDGLIATRKTDFVLLLDHGSTWSGWGEIVLRDDGTQLYRVRRSLPGAAVGPLAEAVRAITDEDDVQLVLTGSIPLDGPGEGALRVQVRTFNQLLGGVELAVPGPSQGTDP